MNNISYASVVGSLMYAHVCTRPDNAYVVEVLGRYQSNPSIDHWKAKKETDDLEVIAYFDSNYVGCIGSQKSTSTYIFMLIGGAISWRSAKQTLITTSTMEVEFVSYFEATLHDVWLNCFISRLRFMDSISKSLKFYCDNLVANVLRKKVVIELVNTKLMIVDSLTKDMPLKNFKDHMI
ncbi:hypothetical protein CR513_37957, partial [Mucuna pruriens]